MSENSPPPEAAITQPRTHLFPRGRRDKFMLLPYREEETNWIEGGVVRIGVEARVVGIPGGEPVDRGSSVHVFETGTDKEWIRFDCFGKNPHYHYILQAEQHNIVWGFDPAINGELYPWVVSMLRSRLPAMLRTAGAEALAEKAEHSPLGEGILVRIEEAMHQAYARTFPGTEMIEPTVAWGRRWKAMNPNFAEVG